MKGIMNSPVKNFKNILENKALIDRFIYVSTKLKIYTFF